MIISQPAATRLSEVTIDTDLDMNGNDIVDSGDISLGADLLKTTNLLVKELGANQLAIRDIIDTNYKGLYVADILLVGSVISQLTNLSIGAINADNGYFRLTARDNGVALVEIARLKGGDDPTFDVKFLSLNGVTPTAGQLLQFNGAGVSPTGINPPEYHLAVPFLFATGPAVSYPISTWLGPGYDLDAAGENVKCGFRIPNHFTSLVAAKIKLMGLVTGTFDWTFSTNWGANGEAGGVDTDSVTNNAEAITTNEYMEIDVTAAFTGIIANDWVSGIFTLDALTTTTNIYLSSIELWYV